MTDQAHRKEVFKGNAFLMVAIIFIVAVLYTAITFGKSDEPEKDVDHFTQVVSQETDRVSFMEIPQSMMDSWKLTSKDNLGNPIWGIEVGDLNVVVGTLDKDSALFGFVDKITGQRVIMTCDSRNSLVDVAYTNGILETVKPESISEFSIVAYPGHYKVIHDADTRREPLFSSIAGDRNLKERLEEIKHLDPDMLVGFAFETYSDKEGIQQVGWSVLYPASQWVEALNAIDLSVCANVELKTHPVQLEEGVLDVTK